MKTVSDTGKQDGREKKWKETVRDQLHPLLSGKISSDDLKKYWKGTGNKNFDRFLLKQSQEVCTEICISY